MPGLCLGKRILKWKGGHWQPYLPEPKKACPICNLHWISYRISEVSIYCCTPAVERVQKCSKVNVVKPSYGVGSLFTNQLTNLNAVKCSEVINDLLFFAGHTLPMLSWDQMDVHFVSCTASSWGYKEKGAVGEVYQNSHTHTPVYYKCPVASVNCAMAQQGQ